MNQEWDKRAPHHRGQKVLKTMRGLVKELRYWEGEYHYPPGLLDRAARRIEELEMEQTPSIGRVVHYVAYGTPGGEFPAGVCRAAVITEVQAAVDSLHVPGEAGYPKVSVCVLNPSGLFFNQEIPYDETKAPVSWHWPERV